MKMLVEKNEELAQLIFELNLKTNEDKFLFVNLVELIGENELAQNFFELILHGIVSIGALAMYETTNPQINSFCLGKENIRNTFKNSLEDINKIIEELENLEIEYYKNDKLLKTH